MWEKLARPLDDCNKSNIRETGKQSDIVSPPVPTTQA